MYIVTDTLGLSNTQLHTHQPLRLSHSLLLIFLSFSHAFCVGYTLFLFLPLYLCLFFTRTHTRTLFHTYILLLTLSHTHTLNHKKVLSVNAFHLSCSSECKDMFEMFIEKYRMVSKQFFPLSMRLIAFEHILSRVRKWIHYFLWICFDFILFDEHFKFGMRKHIGVFVCLFVC